MLSYTAHSNTICKILDPSIVLIKFNISLLQLPQISIKDPMAKAVKADINEVLEIEHKSPTGNKDLFYRRVIE